MGDMINRQDVKKETSCMAVVLCGGKILATHEMIYGREVLSLPKGHVEDGETLIQTAIRECFEETNIALSEKDCVRELTSYSYEFLNHQGKLIRKTIVPFLFKIADANGAKAKEKQMVSVEWMDMDEFLQKCNYDSVKAIVREIL